jgi:drug/metabolite transporter (DMT)-like permease
MMALLAAVFAGLTMTLIKELRETHGSVIIYFYFCLIGTTICIGPFFVNPQLPKVAWEWLIVGGIVFTSIVSQLMMTQGLRYCTSWEGGVFMTSELVFVSIIGILILSEPVTWHFWLGGFLILTSAVMFNLLKAGQIAKVGERNG